MWERPWRPTGKLKGITSLSQQENKNAFQNFELLVTDADKLHAVMKAIGKIKGVHSVERVRG